MSKGDNWQTPQWLFDRYDSIYMFGVDAAADESNHLCDCWYGPGGEREDALTEEPWDHLTNIWCNPPYSRGMQRAFWLKAKECALMNGQVIMLLPADTSTKLFHEIWNSPLTTVEFLRGRVKFVGAPSPAKFGSMIVRVAQK